jgi:hypothetical protein
MQLLASTGPLFARPLDWALGVIAEAGYDGAELMVAQDPATQDAERVAAAADREGVPVPVVHGPFLLLTRRVFGTDLVAKARRSLELAGDLGAGVMIVHPPFRWQRDFHRWLLGEGDEEAAEVGTRIGVENLYPVPVVGRPVRFHRYTLPDHLTQFSHVVLDTSHFGVAEGEGEPFPWEVTARVLRTAEQTAEAVLSELGHQRVADTLGLPIGGGTGFPDDPAVLEKAFAAHHEISSERAAYLVDLYGTRAREILDCGRAVDPGAFRVLVHAGGAGRAAVVFRGPLPRRRGGGPRLDHR